MQKLIMSLSGSWFFNCLVVLLVICAKQIYLNLSIWENFEVWGTFEKNFHLLRISYLTSPLKSKNESTFICANKEALICMWINGTFGKDWHKHNFTLIFLVFFGLVWIFLDGEIRALFYKCKYKVVHSKIGQ